VPSFVRHDDDGGRARLSLGATRGGAFENADDRLRLATRRGRVRSIARGRTRGGRRDESGADYEPRRAAAVCRGEGTRADRRLLGRSVFCGCDEDE
jgi:hypothetical protein